MNRKTYTGVNIKKDSQGTKLVWTGRQYDYLTSCDKVFKTKYSLQEHLFNCKECTLLDYNQEEDF